MAKVKVAIVHDEFGQITSVNRPKEANVIVLAKGGHSVFVTDVDEESIEALIRTHRVDINRKSLVSY
jgi:hypothetical protein